MSWNGKQFRHRLRRRWETVSISPRGILHGGQERTSILPVIHVALAGNPNSGKTSIFNHLTGQHQHIGNYPGVTVDKKTGYANHRGWRIEFVDLPGAYSLTAYSPEEIVTRDFLLRDKPDLIVDVIDSTNLERNLYLLLQFQELGAPVIGVLNMTDEVTKDGTEIDSVQLGKILDLPFVKTVGTHGAGLTELLDLIVALATGEKTFNERKLNYGRELEAERDRIRDILITDPAFAQRYAVDWMSIKLLEDDQDANRKVLQEHQNSAEVLRLVRDSREKIKKHFHEDSVVVVSEQRYAYIHGAVKETLRKTRIIDHISYTERIDRIVLNKYIGVFIFFLIMFLVYQLTFSLGNPLSDWISISFESLGEAVRNWLPGGVFQDLLANGIIGGVGGVLVFFPIVVLLFLGLSFLEDSGYLARAAFVLDKFFHLFGLHGRSFIPFMIATGCAVPAVMSARTLVNPRDRKITILVTPFMVCGAKAPVVAILAAAFFPHNSAFIFWLIWLAGWITAFSIALLFRKTFFRGEDAPFVMELPPYRLPTLRGIITHIWEKSFAYVKKAGTIILAISIVLWFLLNYPKPSPSMEPANQDLTSLQSPRSSEEIRFSYAGRVGVALEPLLRPAGFDWKITVGLFGGLAAKEVIISTMGIVYGIGEANPDLEGGKESGMPLKRLMASDPAYSPATALALMIFVLIYVPCAPTLAVVKKELGSWRWSAFLAVYTLLLAWLLSVIVFQLGRFFGI